MKLLQMINGKVVPTESEGHKRREPATIHIRKITTQVFLAQCTPKIEAAIRA
jgi:hypothetical protein